MKDKLLKLLKAKQEQRTALNQRLIASDDKEERAAIGETLSKLAAEIADVEEMLKDVDAPAPDQGGEEGGEEGRAIKLIGGMLRGAEQTNLEQRKAFQNFIATGTRPDKRTAAGNTTGADNVGSVIPENLLDQIMEKMESLGTIYNLVSKTSYPVGQVIPKESTKPVATWVGRNTTTPASSTSGEGNGSTVQKGVTLDTAISFTHFKLRCEVAMTEEVAQMTLPAFEKLFVKNVSLAMLRAIEFAIVDGDGYGMPTGILSASVPSGQTLEIADDAKIGYKTITDAEALIPAEYETSAKWCMTKKTFMSFVGMVDSVGQPVARVNYGLGGKPERTLLGRDVVLYAPQANSKLGNYADEVEDDTTFAFLFNFEDYTLNNNYDLGIQHKVDWDNEDHRTKAVAAYDGKVVDNGSLVVLVKKAEA